MSGNPYDQSGQYPQENYQDLGPFEITDIYPDQGVNDMANHHDPRARNTQQAEHSQRRPPQSRSRRDDNSSNASGSRSFMSTTSTSYSFPSQSYPSGTASQNGSTQYTNGTNHSESSYPASNGYQNEYDTTSMTGSAADLDMDGSQQDSISTQATFDRSSVRDQEPEVNGNGVNSMYLLDPGYDLVGLTNLSDDDPYLLGSRYSDTISLSSSAQDSSAPRSVVSGPGSTYGGSSRRPDDGYGPASQVSQSEGNGGGSNGTYESSQPASSAGDSQQSSSQYSAPDAQTLAAPSQQATQQATQTAPESRERSHEHRSQSSRSSGSTNASGSSRRPRSSGSSRNGNSSSSRRSGHRSSASSSSSQRDRRSHRARPRENPEPIPENEVLEYEEDIDLEAFEPDDMQGGSSSQYPYSYTQSQY